MSRYRLTVEAALDLEEIDRHLAGAGGRRLADRVLSELRAAARLLARQPGIGHLRPDLTADAVKFWPVFSWLLV